MRGFGADQRLMARTAKALRSAQRDSVKIVVEPRNLAEVLAAHLPPHR